jgi:hypothetical protein
MPITLKVRYYFSDLPDPEANIVETNLLMEYSYLPPIVPMIPQIGSKVSLLVSGHELRRLVDFVIYSPDRYDVEVYLSRKRW